MNSLVVLIALLSCAILSINAQTYGLRINYQRSGTCKSNQLFSWDFGQLGACLSNEADSNYGPRFGLKFTSVNSTSYSVSVYNSTSCSGNGNTTIGAKQTCEKSGDHLTVTVGQVSTLTLPVITSSILAPTVTYYGSCNPSASSSFIYRQVRNPNLCMNATTEKGPASAIVACDSTQFYERIFYSSDTCTGQYVDVPGPAINSCNATGDRLVYECLTFAPTTASLTTSTSSVGTNATNAGTTTGGSGTTSVATESPFLTTAKATTGAKTSSATSNVFSSVAVFGVVLAALLL